MIIDVITVVVEIDNAFKTIIVVVVVVVCEVFLNPPTFSSNF